MTVPVLLAVTALSACQPVAVRSAASTESVEPTGSVSSSPANAGQGEGGPGSITLSVTSPRAVSGHVDTPVTCTTGRIYRASGTGAIAGYTVRVAATAMRYSGPASYQTTLSGSVLAPDGEEFALVGVRTTAAITADGGSAPFTVTGKRGHTMSGTISWSCS
ncbi:MAG: hypothetical protein HY241_05160 [Actinobacteria bacterium]|nr:hypothetical protein [Actinomycetota bacterium]